MCLRHVARPALNPIPDAEEAPLSLPPPPLAARTQLATDSVMKVARSTWLLPDGAERPAYDPALVRSIYASELGNGEKLPPLQRASVLEVSQARPPSARPASSRRLLISRAPSAASPSPQGLR